MQHTPVERQGGFSLLVVLIGLVGLAAVATVGIIAADTDHKMSQNQHAYESAFYAADAGLTDFLVANDTAVVASGSYSYTYGSATVTATPLIDVNDLARLYRVTSAGTYTAPDGSTSTRTLSRIVMYHAGGNNLVAAPGAITALGGLSTSGTATPAQITGYNSADSATCSTSDADISGVSVPDSGYSSTPTDTIIYGEPPLNDEAETAQELGETTGIDWQATIDGTAAPFDHTVARIQSEWPGFSTYGASDWPVTYLDPSNPNLNSLGSNQSGKGMLIVRGDVRLMGGFVWDGVILVGGATETLGNPVVNGALMSGLNIMIGETVDESNFGAGALQINFNSCYAQQAFVNLGQYPPSVGDIPKTWLEAM